MSVSAAEVTVDLTSNHSWIYDQYLFVELKETKQWIPEII